MLNNIKAVIFDLDGTLVDSMWMWREIDVEYLSQFDIEVPSDLLLAGFLKRMDIKLVSLHNQIGKMKRVFRYLENLV